MSGMQKKIDTIVSQDAFDGDTVTQDAMDLPICWGKPMRNRAVGNMAGDGPFGILLLETLGSTVVDLVDFRGNPEAFRFCSC